MQSLVTFHRPLHITLSREMSPSPQQEAQCVLLVTRKLGQSGFHCLDPLIIS